MSHHWPKSRKVIAAICFVQLEQRGLGAGLNRSYTHAHVLINILLIKMILLNPHPYTVQYGLARGSRDHSHLSRVESFLKSEQ